MPTACPLCGRPFPTREAVVLHLLDQGAHSPRDVADALLSRRPVQPAGHDEQRCYSQAFASEQAAADHARDEMTRTRPRRPYFHARCGEWHLSRKPAPPERTSR